MFIGIFIENNRYSEVNQYYLNSEIFLMDIFTLNEANNVENISCDILIESNRNFADKIYEEAILLEEYERVGQLTDSMKIAHKRYDLLRTLLWVNSIKTIDKCDNAPAIVIYLYEEEIDNLAQKATQGVWSKILADFKQNQADRIILIPIAVDGNLVSLNSLIEKYEVTRYPVVIINNEVINKIASVEQLEKYLD